MKLLAYARNIICGTESRLSCFHREGTSRRRICVNSHSHGGNYWPLVTLRRYGFSEIKCELVLTLKNNREYFARAFYLDRMDFCPFFIRDVQTHFSCYFLYYFNANIAFQPMQTFRKKITIFFNSYFFTNKRFPHYATKNFICRAKNF